METVVIIMACIAVALFIAITVLFVLRNNGLINSYHSLKKGEENQIRVACVGDSITYGCMLKKRDDNHYPKILGAMLGESYCVNNFGYTNRTANKSGDHPFVNEKLYRHSLDFEPNIVILQLGSNDSKETNWDREKFLADYGEIIDGYSSLVSMPKIYVLTPPPAFAVRGKIKYRLRKEIIENEIVPTVKELARDKGVGCIDLFDIFNGKDFLFSDGIHLNPEGCRVLAKKVFNALKSDGVL